MDRVATVAKLWRYPVKSMAGQALEEVEIGFQGPVGDRRWAFLFVDDLSRFPWATGRRASEMVLWRATFDDPSDPDRSPVTVHTPDGQVRALDDPALAAELAERTGQPVRLVRSGRGIPDAFPVSVLGTGSARFVGDHRRLRPNVLIDAEPWAEEGWIGRTLQLGDRDDAPRVHLAERDERCAMITIDPDTAKRDPGVQRRVVQERENCLGVYGSVTRTGLVRVGDPVLLVP